MMWDLGSGQPENEQAAAVKKEKQMIFFLESLTKNVPVNIPVVFVIM